jgi:hypothetical protein
MRRGQAAGGFGKDDEFGIGYTLAHKAGKASIDSEADSAP